MQGCDGGPSGKAGAREAGGELLGSSRREDGGQNQAGATLGDGGPDPRFIFEGEPRALADP